MIVDSHDSQAPEVGEFKKKQEVGVAGESEDHPLVIASQEELGGEDAEVTGAFSGEFFYYISV